MIFKEKLKEISDLICKLEAKQNLIKMNIVKYSKFKPELLYNTIINLMSEYENERFILKEFDFKDIYVTAIINSKAIIRDSNISLTKLLILMEDKMALILTKLKKPPIDSEGYMNIYYLDDNNELASNLDLESTKFPYVEEFIEFVIGVRASNDVMILPDRELEELRNTFIIANSKEIKEYQKKKHVNY